MTTFGCSLCMYYNIYKCSNILFDMQRVARRKCKRDWRYRIPYYFDDRKQIHTKKFVIISNSIFYLVQNFKVSYYMYVGMHFINNYMNLCFVMSIRLEYIILEYNHKLPFPITWWFSVDSYQRPSLKGNQTYLPFQHEF